MHRHTYLVAWDVACPRRLVRVGRVAKGWKTAGQLSVAECLLGVAERQSLAAALAGLIDPARDRLHLIRLDPRQPPLLFGAARTQGRRPFVVG
ncbi:MAG: CRISPR-associated endonuclease Cas2 [Sphingomonadaceae bacterium]|uniref:CRISPR-associated endonuclease Cas2 n=1 Tax=Thermaurantiacus sp. TaxID=2820283 RepID=UPI00298F2054|nr:CRISPR-associated endonuclease Cas2 [Thermaurantiacus sp.]MCS6987689.1 CRISPR-associated endonuclease Cas2 [Sphingomonadaceae bacterium]MDW8415913.1 CRISPR-associated endonuclease Cas2 [Thermaurantiacus sp.]